MKEYLKSEQEENVFVLVIRYPDGRYLVKENEKFSEPTGGVVVGTFSIYESGYDPNSGEIYDEVSVYWNNE